MSQRPAQGIQPWTTTGYTKSSGKCTSMQHNSCLIQNEVRNEPRREAPVATLRWTSWNLFRYLSKFCQKLGSWRKYVCTWWTLDLLQMLCVECFGVCRGLLYLRRKGVATFLQILVGDSAQPEIISHKNCEPPHGVRKCITLQGRTSCRRTQQPYCVHRTHIRDVLVFVMHLITNVHHYLRQPSAKDYSSLRIAYSVPAC